MLRTIGGLCHKLIAGAAVRYAVAVDIQRLQRFVACARSKMQAHPAAFGPYGHFPAKCCGPATQMIGRCLVDHFGVEVGVVGRISEAGVAHAWLSLGKVVVDVTHDPWDQAHTGLPRNQWIFERPTAWHKSFDAPAPRIEGLGPLLSADSLRKSFAPLFDQIVACARKT
jgi:hypothetical protein